MLDEAVIVTSVTTQALHHGKTVVTATANEAAHDDQREGAWKLRNNVRAYDTADIALAEALDAPLITCDSPLAESSGHTARIEAIH